MPLVDALARALSFAFGMAWEISWALILGFSLSAVVQAPSVSSRRYGTRWSSRPE